MVLDILQHVPFEGPGYFTVWAKQRGYAMRVCRLYAGEKLPEINRTDIVVVLGGPMNIYEQSRFPWLVAEKRFVREAIRAGKFVVGICLGCQMIADALGSRVFAHTHREIGWFPVNPVGTRTDNILVAAAGGEFMAFHWHGDTFLLPPDTQHLGHSAGCPRQAFRFHEHVLGLQFHLETTPAGVESLVKHCAGELVRGPFVQDPATIRQGAVNCTAMHRVLQDALDLLIG